MKRSRSILVEPNNGGRECGPLREKARCNVDACDDRCNTTKWFEPAFQIQVEVAGASCNTLVCVFL